MRMTSTVLLLLGTLTASDQDTSTILTFRITSGNSDALAPLLFALVPHQGNRATVNTVSTTLDYERKKTYQLMVGVSDGQFEAFSTLTVAINDVNEPPLISRNDAARIVCHVAGEGLSSLGGATLDVAWQDRWGTTSAGTDETARAAARQDVMADAAAAVFGMAKQEEEAAAAAA